jgi:hypothetical protein
MLKRDWVNTCHSWHHSQARGAWCGSRGAHQSHSCAICDCVRENTHTVDACTSRNDSCMHAAALHSMACCIQNCRMLCGMLCTRAERHSWIASFRMYRNHALRAGTQHQAGAPLVETMPTDGFTPTTPLRPAGTRPLPAVSVPSANVTTPSATATAEPEDEPPGMTLASRALGGTPTGDRVPLRPAANWSMFTLPTHMQPALMSAVTAGALVCGVYENAGQAAVVGMPDTSMLSFTAKNDPQREHLQRASACQLCALL